MQRLPLSIKLRSYYLRLHRFVVHHLLHADDPPHRLALGMAIGMFIAITPTVGCQAALTVFVAWLLRANKVVGVPMVWLSNPLTSIPIIWVSYRVGCVPLGETPIGREWWTALSSPPAGWWDGIKFYWIKFMEIAGPLWLGSILVGMSLAIPTYYITYFSVRAYRLRKWGALTPPPNSLRLRLKEFRRRIAPPSLPGSITPRRRGGAA